MLPDFRNTASYNTLSLEDQDLIDRLIDAQNSQGDMLELRPDPSEDHSIDEANQLYHLKVIGHL